jgi:DnaJ-class molecular chaperone
MTIPIKTLCSACHGTGIYTYIVISGSPPVIVDPCPYCEGTKLTNSEYSLDQDTINNIKTKVKNIEDIVKDIWNKIKDT